MKNILKITLILSLFGIFILILIANTLNPKPISINEINNKHLNKNIQVSGEIFNIKSFNGSNFQIISINDETGKIDVTTNKILKVSKNQNIMVFGIVKEYKEFLQIQANKIIIL